MALLSQSRPPAAVIPLGGELNAEIEHQTAKDSTVGDEKPLGHVAP
jgi:hypothetical protein